MNAQVESGEGKNKGHVTDRKLYQNDKRSEAVKSNLHAENKQVHKFTIASGEREKQSSCE